MKGEVSEAGTGYLGGPGQRRPDEDCLSPGDGVIDRFQMASPMAEGLDRHCLRLEATQHRFKYRLSHANVILTNLGVEFE